MAGLTIYVTNWLSKASHFSIIIIRLCSEQNHAESLISYLVYYSDYEVYLKLLDRKANKNSYKKL